MDICNLSIIIPVFNGGKKIISCLDSIYSQGMLQKDFEVICVDDCSTDSTIGIIKEYVQQMGLSNLEIIKHTVNKRQGGGRNTGIEKAVGTYILFVDQDDYIRAGSLLQLMEVVKQNVGIDVFMFDFEDSVDGVVTKQDHYQHNIVGEMRGRIFMQRQEIPWTPWCYLYSKDLLNRNSLRFVENVRFEDGDFVVKCTIHAQRIFFTPLVVIGHTYSSSQGSAVGNNVDKIIDLFRLSDRVKTIAIGEMCIDKGCANTILGHHLFRHKYDIMRFLWRAPFTQMLYILRNYRAYIPNNNRMLTFSANHPLIFAIGLQLFKPTFPILRRIYMLLR